MNKIKFLKNNKKFKKILLKFKKRNKKQEESQTK
jgi:hypothetical protein